MVHIVRGSRLQNHDEGQKEKDQISVVLKFEQSGTCSFRQIPRGKNNVSVVEGCAAPKHPVQTGRIRRYIPFGKIAIEGLASSEHFIHIGRV
mmetsp:Transcript_52655/g.78650  ORF Transcript_52655/g.78650 Transcript_52655/m.78650 type:complete len:92 (+) Transcript_52655:338-613(+)